MLFRLDDYLFHLLYAGGRGPLHAAALVLNVLGGGWGILVILPLALRKDARRLCAWLVGTLLVTSLLVLVLKDTIGRGRPCTVYVDLHDALAASPIDCSFPSGHAAGSFTFAFFVARVLLAKDPRPPYAVPGAAAAIAFATCVALSRVVLGFHFPLDVTAGAALGAGIGAVAAGEYKRRAAT